MSGAQRVYSAREACSVLASDAVLRAQMCMTTSPTRSGTASPRSMVRMRTASASSRGDRPSSRP
eukprot:12566565-Alexandrium_andersonii.AAC.1